MNSSVTPRSAPHPAQTVMQLGEAMGHRRPSDTGRIFAVGDCASPREGARMLKLFIGIEDAQTRQALLDVMVAISENVGNPRSEEGRSSVTAR